MMENDDVYEFASSLLPSGLGTSPSASVLARGPPHSDQSESPLPQLSSGRASSSHTNRHGSHSTIHSTHHKADHFRRLEERIDGLQDEIQSTQKMIQDLTRLMQQQQKSAAIRQNFRTLSGKAMKGQGPRGSFASTLQGPPSSVAIASAFVATLDAHHTQQDPIDGVGMAEGQYAENTEATVVTNIDDELPSAPIEPEAPRRASDAVRKVSSVDHGTRKMSASNPIALTDKSERRASRAVAVSHASRFAELKASSLRKLGALVKPVAGAPIAGPEITRRFSISTLDQTNVPKRESRMSRAVKWSRNLFRPRGEPQVSPEDILDARNVDSKVHPLTIRHDTVKRMIWDVLVIALILVDIAITPLSISFQYYPRGMSAYNMTANVIFAGDFFINMMSSYTTRRGALISGPQQTISHYFLSPWALPDFLSWFPFEVFVQSKQSRFLGIAKFIRLAKVSQLARRFHSAKKAGVFRFIQLLGIVFVVSHLLACYWNIVADQWRHLEDGYLEKTIPEQYAHCWSIVIGSLNASPPAMHTTKEEVSVAFFMIIGNILQATVFGSVAVLISSFDEEEVAYNKKLITTYERCRFLGIPESLAQRIQGYYENLYRETRSVNTDADSFINELSPALICEVKFQLYRDMIKQIPFLSATHINPVVIEMLILHLRTVIYMQDDVLIRKGEFGDWMGFIGSKGSVGVLDPKTEARKIIRILRKGDYFGEMALLQRAKRSTTAIALSWVQIHVLCRNDLDDVKDQYPEQAEILEEEINKYMKSKVTYK